MRFWWFLKEPLHRFSFLYNLRAIAARQDKEKLSHWRRGERENQRCYSLESASGKPEKSRSITESEVLNVARNWKGNQENEEWILMDLTPEDEGAREREKIGGEGDEECVWNK